MDGVIRKKRLVLLRELRRERLVVRDNQRRLIVRPYDIRHGERLAGTGHTQKRLPGDAFLQTGNQTLDGLGLIPRGQIR